MLEPETGEFFTQEDLGPIIEDYQTIKKQIESIPDPREPGETDTGYSDKAYKVILNVLKYIRNM